ncbi:hypothetical protein BGX38DRAFT_1278111 [Terfezia claveryi]|nr:hypothetical protein BGX38DRAFT_1278111 [Terfezia claveryi]
MSNNQGMDWAAPRPPVNTIIPNESASTSSLVDVDSGVTVVPPDFLEQPIKTETQATRIQLEEEARVAAQENQSHYQQQNGKSGKKAVAKKQVRKAENYAERNPVQVVNTVLGVAVTVALGWGVWRRYKVGSLSWRVVGVWGAGVAAVGLLDMVATRLYLDSKKSGH